MGRLDAKRLAERKGKAWCSERARLGGKARWAKRAIHPVMPVEPCIAVVRYHVALRPGQAGQSLILSKLAEIESWLAEPPLCANSSPIGEKNANGGDKPPDPAP